VAINKLYSRTWEVMLADAAVLREGEGLVADDRRVRAGSEPVYRYAALCAHISSSMRDTFAAESTAGSEAVQRSTAAALNCCSALALLLYADS
jgi:uncharacterized protein affecting Mg2+/Co2+ transport